MSKSKEILGVALPSILQQGVLSIGVILITALINQCGTAMIAGVAIGGKIDGVVTLPIVTIAEAIAVFVAQNMGAGKPERIELGLKSAMRLCILLLISLCLLVYFKGKSMIELFLDVYDKEIIDEGMNYLISLLVMTAFMISFRCFNGVFTGLKKMRPVLFAFAMNITCRVAFAYISFPYLGKWAVYIGNPLSVLVGAVVIMSFWMFQRRGVLK